MVSLRAAIETRGALEGARQFNQATDSMKAGAQGLAEEVEGLDDVIEEFGRNSQRVGQDAGRSFDGVGGRLGQELTQAGRKGGDAFREIGRAASDSGDEIQEVTRKASRFEQVDIDRLPASVRDLAEQFRQTGAAIDRTERNASELRRELDRVGDESARSARQIDRIERSSRRARSALRGLILPAGILGGAFALFRLNQGLSEAASTAEETQAKFDTLFGSLATEANRGIDELSDQLGRSRFELQAFSADIATLLQPVGFNSQEVLDYSQALSSLAVDLASFSNTADSDALRAIRSGLVGESEPLRRYGVTLSETKVRAEALALGVADANGELDDQAKFLGRIAIIARETATAQGDAIRTQDSFANSIKAVRSELDELRATAGQRLNQAILEGIQSSGGVEAIRANAEVLFGAAAEIGRVAVAGAAEIARTGAELIERAGGPEGVIGLVQSAGDAGILSIEAVGLRARAFVLEVQSVVQSIASAIPDAVNPFSGPSASEQLADLERVLQRRREIQREAEIENIGVIARRSTGQEVDARELRAAQAKIQNSQEQTRLAEQELLAFERKNPLAREILELERDIKRTTEERAAAIEALTSGRVTERDLASGTADEVERQADAFERLTDAQRTLFSLQGQQGPGLGQEAPGLGPVSAFANVSESGAESQGPFIDGLEEGLAQRNRLLAEGAQDAEIAQASLQDLLEGYRFEAELLGLSNIERRRKIELARLEATGVDETSEAYREAAAALDDLLDRQAEFAGDDRLERSFASAGSRANDFARPFTEAFRQIAQGAQEPADAIANAFDSLGNRLIGRGVDLLFERLLNQLSELSETASASENEVAEGGRSRFGSGFGSALGGSFGFLLGNALFNAKGNAYGGGYQQPLMFANGGLFTRATALPLANGRTGVFGEAGLEIAAPATRNRRGQVAISIADTVGEIAAAMGGGGGGVTQNVYVNGGSRGQVDTRSARQIQKAAERALSSTRRGR